MINYNSILFASAIIATATSCTTQYGDPQKPNVIYILADDLGYGDLSCMGQTHFSTPNIDRLAAEGLLFTDHYAGCSVSAPSRSTLLTGQHTGHTYIRGNKALPVEGQEPLPADTHNVMRLFKSHGYTTGTFGKWGLGAPGTCGAPSMQGVDTFFGYNCQRMAHNYYPDHLWDNDEIYVMEGNTGADEALYAPYLIHDRARQFIKDNKNQPFFMYYASILPHAELRLPESEIAPFRGKYDPASYKGSEPGDKGYRVGGYGSQEDTHAAFAAMVTLLDKQVGDIMTLLEEEGLAENTILFFTSDNGPHNEGGADPEYFNSNGALKGIKRDLYEGGIRVPFIAKWQGKIAPNTTTNHISAFWDFLPTMTQLLGAKLESEVNGRSYLPTLLGESSRQSIHPYLYWEFHEKGGRQAVRMGKWKAVLYNKIRGGEWELYDLSTDIGEENNLAKDNPEILEQIDYIIKSARSESALFNFGR